MQKHMKAVMTAHMIGDKYQDDIALINFAWMVNWYNLKMLYSQVTLFINDSHRYQISESQHP